MIYTKLLFQKYLYRYSLLIFYDKKGAYCMLHLWDGISNYIMKFSYKEKRMKRLNIFKQEIIKYRTMDMDELKFEYVEVKTEYEHKKNVLTLFVISVSLAVLMNIWGKFFGFMEAVWKYSAALADNTTNATMMCFFIAVIIAVSITIIVLIFLLELSKELKKMRRDLTIIENIIEERTP